MVLRASESDRGTFNKKVRFTDSKISSTTVKFLYIVGAMKQRSLMNFLYVFCALFVTGCVDTNNPYPYGGYGAPQPSYGSYGYDGYDNDYYRRRELDRQQRQLNRERDRVQDERERLQEERRRIASQPPPYTPPPRVQERCPSGFSPSEQKCSAEERRRGCKDMRLPGGLGCVRR